MSAKNIYHDVVVDALVAEGWTITDDPLRLSYGGRNLAVDLGLEKCTVGAEKEGQVIAIEIQSFLGKSAVRDLEQAVGQYVLYRLLLNARDPRRKLFLAVPNRTWLELFSDQFGQFVIEGIAINLLIYDPKKRRNLSWKPRSDTGKSSAK